MSALLKDIRYSFRILLRNPGFTIVALLALALGIGANTAIFSVVNGVLVNAFPYPDADRLVVIWETSEEMGVKRAGPSGPNYLDWRDQSSAFEQMALVEPGSATLIGAGEPEQVPGMRVTTSLLDLLGGKMVLGRWFRPEEGHDAGDNVVVLSHNYWRSRAGSDPDVIGRKYVADGLLYTVIGVASPEFRSPVPADLFVPWSEADLRDMNRNGHDFGVLARLKPGVTVAQAEAELGAIHRTIGEQYPELRPFGVTVAPLKDALFEGIRRPLLVLLAAVGFVLLIACANVANLLLAKAASREREVAMRTALGASRWQVLRQFLTESVILAFLGGICGLLLAVWGVAFLRTILPGTIAIPNAASEAVLARVELDTNVLVYTFLLTLVTGLIFGLGPAIKASKGNVSGFLKQSGRGTTADSGHRRLRDLLVVSEIALALVLLAGAALMMSSFQNLLHVNPGFRTDGLLTLQMEIPTDSRYRQGPERSAFLKKVMDEVGAIPGIESAGFTQVLPLDPRIEQRFFNIEGDPPLPDGAPGLVADFSEVGPAYFSAMGIPLVQGRFFTDHDNRDRHGVAIVSESLAESRFSGRNPLGRRLLLDGSSWEIVGVVGDVCHEGLDKAPQPTIYLPYYQHADNQMSLVVRADREQGTLTRQVKEAVWRVDKDQPLYRIRTMEEVVAEARVAARLTVILLCVFAALALLMAAIGVYGVMSNAVSQRRQEIGLRLAVGANSADVFRLILGRSLLLSFAGVALGLALSMALSGLLGSLLYGVSATDPLVFFGVALVLVCVAVAASYVPARRATRVDPVVTLRYE